MWRTDIVNKLSTPDAHPDFLDEVITASYDLLAARLQNHTHTVSDQVDSYIHESLLPLIHVLTEDETHLSNVAVALNQARMDLGSTYIFPHGITSHRHSGKGEVAARQLRSKNKQNQEAAEQFNTGNYRA